MADNAWSVSGCRPDVQWYGIPGLGAYYYTRRFGQFFVSGGVHAKYAQVLYECGMLGVPVKNAGWISEFGGNGQWFEGGCIVFIGGVYVVKVGYYGQY